jgi:hypothetical protein
MLVAILALVVAMSGSAYALQRAQSGDSLIAKRTLSGNRLRLHTVTGTEVAKLQWHNLSLINGWTNYNGNKRTPAWALDVQGVVHFRGGIKQTSGSNRIFTKLPKSIRPAVDVWISTNMFSAAPGRIDVYASGVVYVQEPNGVTAPAQGFTSLDGVTYSVH